MHRRERWRKVKAFLLMVLGMMLIRPMNVHAPTKDEHEK